VTALLVALGAAVGAPLRYLTDVWIGPRDFPWATLAVNVAGSLLLGLLAGGAARGAVSAGLLTLAGTGFCGALTTYSTFSYQTLQLLESGRIRAAVLNVLGSVTACVLAAAAGWGLAFLLWAPPLPPMT
jgi:CrcB protein